MLRVVSSVERSEESELKPSNEFILAEPRDTTTAAENHQTTISSAEDALGVLRSKPKTSQVIEVLKFLDPAGSAESVFNITVPGSTAAQILHVLVSATIPDHWKILSAENELDPSSQKHRGRHKARAVLLRCLSSVPGIGALLAQLRKLMTGLSSSGQHDKGQGTPSIVRDLLDALSTLLKPHDVLLHIYSDTAQHVQSSVQKHMIWKELVSYLAAGKVLSIAAEAAKVIDGFAGSKFSWVGEGCAYVSWLGRQISYMAIRLDSSDADGWSILASLTGRALSLGYTNQLVGKIFSEMFFNDPYGLDKFGTLLDGLRQHEQKKMFEAVLHNLQTQYLSQYQESSALPEDEKLSTAIGGVSAVVAAILKDRIPLKEQLKDWLVTGVGGNISSITMRRALLAALEGEAGPDILLEILEKGIELFGDKLAILHSPIRAQEGNAQVILLAAGYVHRSSPTRFSQVTRTGTYLSGVSNHLAASSQRSRFLGMAVAMAFSKLVDTPDNALKFDVPDMEGQEAQWYIDLPKIKDSVGTVTSLKSLGTPDADTDQKQSKEGASKYRSSGKPKPNNHVAKAVIEEISEGSEEEDEDLMMYEKPDTDASDSEDDPTLVQRSKPTAPVYIRDLLVYLRDSENVDRYHLGITTAPSLIRRKASFGSEVLEHSKDLGLVLVSLQDKYKLPKFQELRIQGLVALLTAYPLTMGKWAAHTLFNADLSQNQRSSVLIAMGVSARELGGYKEDDAKILDLPSLASDTAFPSKRLPAHLQDVYATTPEAIETISKNISLKTLQPLALNAADTLTGPNALKVRTFSSRMEVEKRRQQRELQRKQTMSADLHKTLSDGFFTPLINEFGLMMYSTASFTGYNPFMQAHLLSLFIQTITILLSTLGPYTPNLASLTLDALTLLMTLHNLPIVAEPVVLTAVLRLFLAVVDLNTSSGSTAEERLVTEFATQVLEMQEWVGGVFERASKDDEEVRMLAAGIMVKLGEVTERYQGRLLGINTGFAY
ncbi:hypothetical protein VTO42DRAFT_4796 [Malbranchea cinnamomea]